MAAVTRSASASPSVAHTSNHHHHHQQHHHQNNTHQYNHHHHHQHQHSIVDPSLFPLKSIADVVKFFRRSLEQWSAGGQSQASEPDLTLLSIVAGYIELSLTTGDAIQAAEQAMANASTSTTTTTPLLAAGVGSALAAAPNSDVIMSNSVPFPVVTYELVSGLYKKFQSILSVVEKPKSTHNRQATREIIKKVSDVIWHSLIRSSYKDRAHLQNLYSYLSGNKLDCFGVALAVVAGCQLLGYRDVHLAISEDHAWVVFGSKRIETIEVTWHGKGSEDKRGQDITAGIESGSWLYLGGVAVVCDRAMEVAGIVSAINISMTANSDCVEVADMQQKLLWLLYDMGHLKKYPMALGTLGELEEVSPTPKRSTCDQLYREAIQSARDHYRNHHVYPHTYQGNYYNRLLKYREAFSAWANAADVIRLYTYSCRDDEEIYKELLDIANEMIPHVMKTESSGHSARSILRDSEAFANLLRFYDGICQWEEDSLTPILHIGWAKPLVNNITKFDYDIRSQVVIKVPEDASDKGTQSAAVTGLSTIGTSAKEKEAAVTNATKSDKKSANNEPKSENNNAQNTQTESYNLNNNNVVKKDEKTTSDGKKTDMPTTLADLTAACGEKILNPEFLLQGGGQPFAEQKKLQEHKQMEHKDEETNGYKNMQDNSADHQKVSTKQNDTSKSISKQYKLETVDNLKAAKIAENIATPIEIVPAAVVQQEEDPFEFMLKRPIITLYSQKMKGLKDLLLAEKLNTHAISLQVTAQSVASKKVRGIDKLGNHTTTSTYATVHAGGASQASSHHHHAAESNTSAADTAATSIAASRPKRTRRE